MSGSREAEMDGLGPDRETGLRNCRPIRDWKGPRAIW